MQADGYRQSIWAEGLGKKVIDSSGTRCYKNRETERLNSRPQVLAHDLRIYEP